MLWAIFLDHLRLEGRAALDRHIDVGDFEFFALQHGPASSLVMPCERELPDGD
jgi:hypothetical protein